MKEKFRYFHHPILEADCKENLSTKEIVVDERDRKGNLIRYSKNELDIIRQDGGKIDKTVHNIKKIFEGVLI